jgi:hypothetical protein
VDRPGTTLVQGTHHKFGSMGSGVEFWWCDFCVKCRGGVKWATCCG